MLHHICQHTHHTQVFYFFGSGGFYLGFQPVLCMHVVPACASLCQLRVHTPLPAPQALCRGLVSLQRLKLSHVAGLSDCGLRGLSCLTGLTELSVLAPANKAVSQDSLQALAPLRDMRWGRQRHRRGRGGWGVASARGVGRWGEGEGGADTQMRAHTSGGRGRGDQHTRVRTQTRGGHKSAGGTQKRGGGTQKRASMLLSRASC